MKPLRRACVFLLALAAAWPCGASTFVALSERELVAASDAVVRGRVVSVESFWNDDHTLIVSEAVFEVESAVLGAPSRFVTLRTAGGTVGENRVEAIGFPVFREGERALLFLERDDKKPLGGGKALRSADGYRIAGYQRGQYRIFRDRNGEEIAVPAADPTVRVLRKNGRLAEPPAARRLQSFENEIRRIGSELRREAEASGRSRR